MFPGCFKKAFAQLLYFDTTDSLFPVSPHLHLTRSSFHPTDSLVVLPYSFTSNVLHLISVMSNNIQDQNNLLSDRTDDELNDVDALGHMNGHGNGAVRRRASRAGTRSVSTLSAVQLERKRANDREAQRAIRQRTKENTERLEKRVTDLEHELASVGAGPGTATAALHERIRQQEAEIQMLRMRLDQAALAMGVENGGKFSKVICARIGLLVSSSVTHLMSRITHLTRISLTLHLCSCIRRPQLACR